MADREKDWRIGPVVYQVFVDRWVFPEHPEAKRRMYSSGSRTFQPWSQAIPPRGVYDKEVGYWTHELDFWGGDLRGAASKVSYLQDLGVDVLYLQPIHEAYSNHKYDATDYLKVDPGYGTLEDFEALAQRLHASNLRLVLDGVFNHAGVRSGLFQDAKKDEKSARRSWFYFGDEHRPLGYKGWANSASLPELRQENPKVRDYCWRAKDSVVATWLRRGADGWRLDVASELGLEHLAELTAYAHRHKPGSLVVGESWVWPAQWTRAMDGLLSFQLGFTILALARGTYHGPSAGLAVRSLVEASSIEEVLRSWIVLGNHDTKRVLTALGGDTRLLRFATALQFALPGAPVIYYGDELGQEGGEDPENRGPMQWDRVQANHEVLQWFRRLVKVRRKVRSLRIGDYQVIPTGTLMVFMRTTDRLFDTAIVVANPTDAEVTETFAVPLPTVLGWTLFADQLSDFEVRTSAGLMEVKVPPKTVRLLSVPEEEQKVAQYKRINPALPVRVQRPWILFGCLPCVWPDWACR